MNLCVHTNAYIIYVTCMLHAVWLPIHTNRGIYTYIMQSVIVTQKMTTISFRKLTPFSGQKYRHCDKLTNYQPS